MKDHADPRQSFLFKLSREPGLEHFKHILLCGSSQDNYVPIHSAHIELCTAAVTDSSAYGLYPSCACVSVALTLTPASLAHQEPRTVRWQAICCCLS